MRHMHHRQVITRIRGIGLTTRLTLCVSPLIGGAAALLVLSFLVESGYELSFRAWAVALTLIGLLAARALCNRARIDELGDELMEVRGEFDRHLDHLAPPDRSATAVGSDGASCVVLPFRPRLVPSPRTEHMG